MNEHKIVSQTSGDLRSSIPLPRLKKGTKRWQVEVCASGLLKGCDGPPMSTEASPFSAAATWLKLHLESAGT